MTGAEMHEPEYVAARRVLLDALEAHPRRRRGHRALVRGPRAAAAGGME